MSAVALTLRLGLRATLLGLCVALAPSLAQAQPVRRASIDAYVRSEMERRHIPGLALLVVRGGNIAIASNYGVRDLETKSPVTDRTTFEIASMTKQFTDAAILLLAERGALAVSDRLSNYFTDLPPAWRSMTIAQLMNHTAGLRDDWDEDDTFFTSKTTSDEFFDALKSTPLKFEPGTDWSYGCGPFVLGLLIERVTGASYAEFMRESIFAPLGMSSTHVNDPRSDSTHHAAGNTMRDGNIDRGVHISPAAWRRGDVGITTSARDLATWDAALTNGTLLSPASRALIFTPGRLRNLEVIPTGFGWFVTPFRGHTEIAHGGAFRTGFNSVIARYPDDSLTVIILSNQYRARTSEMARGVAAFFNGEYRPIRVMPLRRDDDTVRTQLVSRVMDALRVGGATTDLLPDIGRLGGWSRSELREELSRADGLTFIGCQNLSGKHATAFATPLTANCFYRTEGDRIRYWTFSFSTDGRVAYLELEQ